MAENYDEFREMMRDRPAAEKLAALRSEMLVSIMTIRGYAELMKINIVENPNEYKVPEDFSRWVQNIANAGEKIQNVLDALTRDLNS